MDQANSSSSQREQANDCEPHLVQSSVSSDPALEIGDGWVAVVSEQYLASSMPEEQETGGE